MTGDVSEPRATFQGKTHSPRTTWTLWRSPASHGETGAAAIWKETSSGRESGLSLLAECCRTADRQKDCSLLRTDSSVGQTEYYSSCELDWTGCLTAGSDMRWHHSPRVSCPRWTREFPSFWNTTKLYFVMGRLTDLWAWRLRSNIFPQTRWRPQADESWWAKIISMPSEARVSVFSTELFSMRLGNRCPSGEKKKHYSGSRYGICR